MTRWVEVAVEADAEAAEEVSGVLQRFCPDGVVAMQLLEATEDAPGWESSVPAGPITVRGYLPDAPSTGNTQRRIEEAIWHVSTIVPGTVRGPHFRPVQEEDWANAWKRYYHPQRIGRRLLLAPTWETVTPASGDVLLRLDPGGAFGTGLHPTTRLALRLLEETPLTGKRVLDVGTGSGILAIAAALLGASEVLAVDTGPQAVEVATENVRVNDLAGTVTVREGSLEAARAEGPFDLVVANIVAKVLIALAPGLTALVAPEGQAILSGIIEPAEIETLLRYAVLDFAPVERLDEADWRAIRLQRVQACTAS